MFSVEDGTEVTAVPKDSILWGICKKIYKTKARILQGCFFFGDFQNPVSDKILWDLISKLPFLILLQKIYCYFSMKGFRIQFWVCNFDRISALLFLFLLVSSFLGWRQNIKKSNLFASGFQGVYTSISMHNPKCSLQTSAEVHRTAGFVIFWAGNMLVCTLTPWMVPFLGGENKPVIPRAKLSAGKACLGVVMV